MGNRGMRDLEPQAELLSNEVSTLLTNEQSRRISVSAQVVLDHTIINNLHTPKKNNERIIKTHRADTEVDTFEVLRAVNAQALVNDTTPLTRLHRASTERVPRGLDVV